MAIKNLIVNADDFGWSEGVNRGIADAHRHGLVTSTSLLANGMAFAHAVDLARRNPGLGVGVHLNLSNGPPAADPATIESLLDKTKLLRWSPSNLLARLAVRQLVVNEVEHEWNAQIQKILGAGISPTHLDGHKHVHMLPRLFELALNLARRHKIPAIRVSHEASTLRAALSCGASHKRILLWRQGMQARSLKLLAPKARMKAYHAAILTADNFCGIAQTGELTLEGVNCMLRALPDGATEFMCHPGYLDRDLQNSPTRLQASRQVEVEILTNIGLRNFVAQQGIRLINYSQLADQA